MIMLQLMNAHSGARELTKRTQGSPEATSAETSSHGLRGEPHNGTWK
jgi:hypothetical protein